MKKFSILALVLAFTMMLSVVSFAADPAFKIDTERTAENYDSAVTTVTPGANSIAVSTKATDDAYYGVLLINGSALPTVDDDILYIDQATAKDGSVAFNVLPIIPADDLTKDLTLYISSNATDAKLIKVPVAYGTEVVEEDILLGDVTDDTFVDYEDAYVINLYDSWDYEAITGQGYPKFWDENDDTVAAAVGDVTGDGFVDYEDAYVINLYDSWDYEAIIGQGYPQFWPDEL